MVMGFIYNIDEKACIFIYICGDFGPGIDLIALLMRPCIWGTPSQSPLLVLALAGDYWNLQTPQTV